MKTGNPEIDNTDADYIIGSDECGYGAWAGPLVVCAALVSRDWPLASIVCDSKDLKTEAKREAVCRKIKNALLWVIVSTPPEEIDKTGVYAAVQAAHKLAIKKLLEKHEATGCVGKILTVVDGNLPIPGAISLPKADALVPAVSAASIIGKVARDLYMIKEAQKYPGYDFARNKGYGGAPAHVEGLNKLGPCAIHRKSYGPIRDRLQKATEQQEAWGLLVDDDDSV